MQSITYLAQVATLALFLSVALLGTVGFVRLSDSVSSAVNDLKAIKNQTDAAAIVASETKTEVVHVKSEFEKNQNALAGVKSSVTDLSSKVDGRLNSLEQNLGSNIAKTGTLHNKLDELETKSVKAAESLISELKTLTGKVNLVNQTLGPVEGKKEDGKKESVSEALDRVNGKLKMIDSTIQSLENDVNKLKDKKDNLPVPKKPKEKKDEVPGPD
jgi:chromosome segregation ATPase